MSSQVIELFLRFCMDANIDHKNPAEGLQKYLLVYQRNLLHRAAFEVLFERQNKSFINWEYTDKNLPRLENCKHWLTVFQFIDFSTVPKNKSMLKTIDTHLKEIGIVSTDKATDLTCQVFLLKNTSFITARHGVERLFSESEVPDARSKCLQFFALCADSSFDVQEITTVFCHIMQTCAVRLPELEKQIQFLTVRDDGLTVDFRMKQIRISGGRPRLRSKLSEIQKENRSVFDMDSFPTWCQSIRFPNVFSLHTKHKLYFLMAQPHIPEPLEHVHRITNDTYVSNAMRSAAVKKPDQDIIHRVITSLRLIDEPFKELQEFRCDCMDAFPITQLNAMRLNDLLHLYVCAYQNPLVWKDVWKTLVPLLSHQVIRDVETFTAKKAFNYHAILGILNQ
jgi:hypothetical protein